MTNTINLSPCSEPANRVSSEVIPHYHLRRFMLTQLVAEAARKDWELIFPVTSPTALSPQSRKGDSTAATLFASEHNKQDSSVLSESPLALHRHYWRYVMHDALQLFESTYADRSQLAVIAQAEPVPEESSTPHLALDNTQQHLANHQRLVDAAAASAAYQSVVDRLARRRMWRSPISSCVETGEWTSIVAETECIINPTRHIWKQQAQRRAMLQALPEGKLFFEPA